jgi:hypothetical protein
MKLSGLVKKPFVFVKSPLPLWERYRVRGHPPLTLPIKGRVRASRDA